MIFSGHIGPTHPFAHRTWLLLIFAMVIGTAGTLALGGAATLLYLEVQTAERTGAAQTAPLPRVMTWRFTGETRAARQGPLDEGHGRPEATDGSDGVGPTR